MTEQRNEDVSYLNQCATAAWMLADEALSATPPSVPAQQGEAEEWAEEWHRVVELTLRMMGLSSAMGASEALAAIHEYFVRMEEPSATPPTQDQKGEEG